MIPANGPTEASFDGRGTAKYPTLPCPIHPVPLQIKLILPNIPALSVSPPESILALPANSLWSSLCKCLQTTESRSDWHHYEVTIPKILNAMSHSKLPFLQQTFPSKGFVVV